MERAEQRPGEPQPRERRKLEPSIPFVLACSVLGGGIGTIVAGPVGLYIGSVTAAATATYMGR